MGYTNHGKEILHTEQGTEGHVVTRIADACDNEKAHFLVVAANAYSDFDYMAEADKTCSIVFGTHNVIRDDFVSTLKSIAEFCEVLNLHKKLLFRGKTPEQVGFATPTLAYSLAVEFDPNNTAQCEVDLLHGIVGVITEAGEMAEVLIRRIETGEFDRVNAMEEGGDVLWYLARQLRGMNADFDIMGRMNIDKLHGRHGEAFDIFRDANRDLAAERKGLEMAAAPLFDEQPIRSGNVLSSSDPALVGKAVAFKMAPGHELPEPSPAPAYGDCMGTSLSTPPEPGLVWHEGCWRREFVRDVPGLAD